MACNGLGVTTVSSCSFTTGGLWLLDLSINVITSIPAGQFSYLAGSLTSLFLDINRITRIDAAAFTNLVLLNTV